jgi:hypothetical protein
MEQAGKKIASHLKASNALEKYLQEDRPLTPLEHQTIETTIMGLQTLLGSWTGKHRSDESSILSQLTTRKAAGS